MPISSNLNGPKLEKRSVDLPKHPSHPQELAHQLEEQSKQLQEKTDLIQGIIINIPTGLYVYDPIYDPAGMLIDFRLVLLNPLAAELVNRPAEELIGESLTHLLPSMGITNLLVLGIKVFQTRETHHLETPYHLGSVDGWYKVSISRYDHRIIVTTIDISNLKQVQSQLHKVTETMQTMLDDSPIAISQLKAVRDPQEKIIDLVYVGANEKYAVLLNRPLTAIIGQPFLELFPGARDAIFDDCIQIIETGEPRRFENYSQAEPIIGWFDLTIVKNDDGVVISYLDMNDRKAAEQLLETTILDLQIAKSQMERDLLRLQVAEEEVNRLLRHEREINIHKTQFIAFVTHQFRNPMTSILLAAEALANFSKRSEGPLLAQKVAHYTHQTRQEIQRLDRLLTKVLFQEGMPLLKIALQSEQVDLVVFCENLIAHLRQQDVHYLRVEFQPEAGKIMVRVDPVILEQVLENLMSNALKYSAKSDKPVEVRIAKLADEIKITVKDYGIGIPPEDLEHIGKSFFRGSNTSFISGIGLGLSLSRQFIKQHGGRLEVESELGYYTLCTIVLPRSL